MEAIILARKDIREFDQIVTIFSKEGGRQELVIRGVKKIKSKNAAHIEPCCFVSVDIARGKDLDYLVRSIPINIFKEIRSDVAKSYVAQYICQFVLKISKQNEVNIALYETILWSLHILEATKKPFVFLNIFLLEIVSCVGFKPSFHNCVICDKEQKYNMSFVSKFGGICCNKCIPKERKLDVHVLTKKDMKIIDLYLTKNFEQIEYSISSMGGVHKIVLDYIRFHIEMYIPDWVKY